MVAGGSDILRTPRPGEHKRRTIYERRISRCYARPRLPPTIAKPAKLRPAVARPGRSALPRNRGHLLTLTAAQGREPTSGRRPYRDQKARPAEDAAGGPRRPDEKQPSYRPGPG